MCETVESICFTCLSTNRVLLPINEHKSAIQNWTKNNVTDYCKLCWECTAIFKRIENFKMQVLQASTLLNKFIRKEIMTFPTLSKLDVTDLIFDNIYNDSVKEESNISEDDGPVGDDNDSTVGDDIKFESLDIVESPIDTIKIEPYDTNDRVCSELDNIERKNDSLKTLSGFENLMCDNRNIEVTENIVVYDYNTTTDTVANCFVSDINISNQFKAGEKTKYIALENIDDDNSRINKKFYLLDVPSSNTNISDLIPVQKAQTLSNDSHQIDVPKLNSVKVTDRYIILIVNEEEMLIERQKERESDSYKKSTYKCEDCIVGYTGEAHYLNHRKKLHSETLQIKCPTCKCTFADAISLEFHKKGHYQIYQCSECTFRHIRTQRVVVHYGRHHLNQEFYTCSKCLMKFGSKSELMSHRSKAHVSMATCQTCGIECNVHNLKRHMLLHTGMPQYKCGICNKYYRGKPGLERHIKYIHSDTKPEEAYCAKCDVQFKGIYTYKNHIRTVHAPKRVECHECGKHFVHKTYLKRHIMFIHSTTTKFSCNLCPKTFTRPESVKQHIRLVHENKPSIKGVCEICAKPMKTKHQLREHLNTHTGSRPYKCDKCSSTFKHQGALYMHIKLVHYKLKRSDKVKIFLKKQREIN